MRAMTPTVRLSSVFVPPSSGGASMGTAIKWGQSR